MGGKILILFLVLITSGLWATNELLDNNINKKYKKILNSLKSDKVEVIVEGVVTNVDIIKEKIIPTKALEGKNIEIISKVTFRVLENYKKNVKKEVNVYIKGGLYYKNGKQVYRFVSNEAHSLLENGDHILMGLRRYRDGYTHVFAKTLQLPYSENLIDNIEKQKKEHKLRKLYIKNKNYTSIDEDKIKKRYKKNAKEKKAIIKILKKKLKTNFRKMGVINE